MNNKVLAPLVRRIRLALGRSIIRLVNDSEGIQKLQLDLMANETRSRVERFQEYGLTSVPLDGAEAAVVFLGGNRDHGIIIATDDRRYRLKNLEGGEVALYTDEGDYIHLKRDNNIEVQTDVLTIKATTKVRIESPLVETTGDIIDQEDASNPHTVREMREIYNAHTHTGDSGGTTSDPGQKQGE